MIELFDGLEQNLLWGTLTTHKNIIWIDMGN